MGFPVISIARVPSKLIGLDPQNDGNSHLSVSCNFMVVLSPFFGGQTFFPSKFYLKYFWEPEPFPVVSTQSFSTQTARFNRKVQESNPTTEILWNTPTYHDDSSNTVTISNNNTYEDVSNSC